MLKHRIYFFANFGDWKQQPYGGGEIGNRRTLSMMKRAGYEVRLIEKYNRVFKHTKTDAPAIVCLMAWNIIKFFCILLFGRRMNSIVHVVGFYGSTIYFERMLVAIAHYLGYRTIYEMRGGGATFHYENGTKYYKKCFANTITQADFIFSQGQENKPLIEAIEQDKHFFYYPNCVMRDFCPREYPRKPSDRINLFYFGRVSKQKNLDIVVDVFSILAQEYSNIYLDIVGNCTEPTYAEFIKERISESPYSERIAMHPACNHDKLKEHLVDKHFYIFPTTEPREGHSNALTEAMTWGLIPITTAMGFNRTITGKDELIVDQLSADSFAVKIKQIIEDRKINVLSHYAYDRIQNNYTEEIIYQKIQSEYHRLFNQ